jgi:hypothetical protein
MGPGTGRDSTNTPMHHGRPNLTREEDNRVARHEWCRLIAAVAAVVVIGGCHREPKAPSPASAPAGTATTGSTPLPSWNDGVSRSAIVEFVARVTRERSADFVPVAERIAVFDNDGTLWAEQPMYFQLAFALDRVKALAPKHREWRGLDEAAVRRWVVVDMKQDWRGIFPEEASQ